MIIWVDVYAHLVGYTGLSKWIQRITMILIIIWIDPQDFLGISTGVSEWMQRIILVDKHAYIGGDTWYLVIFTCLYKWIHIHILKYYQNYLEVLPVSAHDYLGRCTWVSCWIHMIIGVYAENYLSWYACD